MDWKTIEQDGVPDSDRLVLTAIDWGNAPEAEYGVEYGTGQFEDGQWWHTIYDDILPTHWADFDRLPLTPCQPKADDCLAIAGMKIPLEEVCILGEK